MRSQKTLARRIAALEKTRGPRRSLFFWDDQDGHVQLETVAMKESGEIGNCDEVRIFRWMPEAPAMICASTKSLSEDRTECRTSSADAGLRAARILAGLTQKQFAKAVGVHERAVRYWELKENKLPTAVPDSLEKIEAVLRRRGAN
jgi:DNA-binding transcriptional regulator YiaG